MVVGGGCRRWCFSVVVDDGGFHWEWLFVAVINGHCGQLSVVVVDGSGQWWSLSVKSSVRGWWWLVGCWWLVDLLWLVGWW